MAHRLDSLDPDADLSRQRSRAPAAVGAEVPAVDQDNAVAAVASQAMRELGAERGRGERGGSMRRITGVTALQRTVGNAAIGRMLAVQRHPQGAGLTIDAEAAVADAQAPAGMTPATGAVGALPEGVQAGPAPAEAAPAPGEEAVAGSEAPSAEDKKEAPKPAKPAYLDLATAKTVLEKTYGKTYTIGTGSIAFLDDNEATWKKYDDVAIGDKVTGWTAGKAKLTYPLGINGFFDKTGGTSYINKASAIATTTPHEMLHANTAANFRSSVGETLNEGVTQWLCVKALKDSSITVPTALPYADEVGVAQALVDLVGESMVTEAYFKGGDATTKLIGEVDKKATGAFSKVKSEGDKKDYTKAKDLLKPKPKKEDAAMIDTNAYGETSDTAYA